MSQKPARPKVSEVKHSNPEFQPDSLQDKLEGTWLVIAPPELDDEEFFSDFEEYKIYISQDEDDPYRFTGLYNADFLHGSMDFRVMPMMGTSEETAPIFFTYDEEDEFDESNGGGFVSLIEPGVLAGLKMVHMAENIPIFWRRLTKEVPDLAEQMGLDLDDEIFSYSSEFLVDESLLQRVFRVHVTLEAQPEVWREFLLLGEHTLHDLHKLIQEGFGWGNLHLYSFLMNDEWEEEAELISHPFAGDEHDATELELASLALEVGHSFLYVYDSDEVELHKIRVLSIGESTVPTQDKDSYPRQSDGSSKTPQTSSDLEA